MAIEPSRIDIDYSTGAAWADHLTEWEGWGTARATAEGVLHLNTCRPYCAAGNFKAYKGRVTLFKVRTLRQPAPLRRHQDRPRAISRRRPGARLRRRPDGRAVASSR